MNMRFVSITENVFLYRDTCNVFVIRTGSSCVLIDFGSGQVLCDLPALGIDRVSAIFHTHHHRDQAQGDAGAIEAEIPIFVPRHERHLFDQVEVYWSAKQLYDMVNVRNSYFTLTESIPVSGQLIDFDTFTRDGITYDILPSPGHTPGSISLSIKIDDESIIFTGDLLHSPGKVHTLFDMQHAYASLDGVEAAALSLSLLRENAPKFLCPSHGEIMPDAVNALASAETNLRSYFRLLSGGRPLVDEHDFTRVNSRLLYASYANSSFYVILSRDGKRALLVDYGAANDAQFSPSTLRSEPGETVRFFPHSLRKLTAQYGVESIEAVIPTHCHDDHVCGIPFLIKHYGSEVWALDVMKNILENPADELTGCVFPDPIIVTRVLKDG
jgi:glyoxylase-like metal-dependent hydrolase (beta-lactamase superfamily II)